MSFLINPYRFLSGGFIYTGGIETSTAPIVTTRKYTSGGNEILSGWPLDSDAVVYGIAIDSDGNVITAGSNDTRKYNSSGNEISSGWPISPGIIPNDVTTDSNDNVIIVGYSSDNSVTTRAYQSNGTLLWTANHADPVPSGGGFPGLDPVYGVNSVAVDSNDNVITGGSRPNNITTRKYDSGGNEIFTGNWPLDHGTTVNCVAVDSNDNVITVGGTSSNSTIRKYDSSGSLLLSKNLNAIVNDVAVDSNDNIITVGERESNITTRKYDPNLVEIITGSWPVDHGGSLNGALGVAIDSNDNVITVGDRAFGITTRKYDSSGTLLWTADHGELVHCVATTE